MANNQIWFRVNGGNWNGNPAANPATQTGGLDLTGVSGAMAGPYFAAVGMSTNFFGEQMTVNLGGSAFAQTPPAGAVAWGGTLNPSDKASTVALSGGNLIASCGGETQGGVRSVVSQNAGNLVYFEAVCNAATSPLNWAAGVATATAQINPPLLQSHWLFAGWASASHDGSIQVNNGYGTGVVQGSLGSSIGVGDVICVALFLGGIPPTDNMADFFFTNTDGYVSMADAANRRKFVDITGCPQFLGATGQLPFNQSPALFLTATATDASAFAANKGLGGGLSGGSALTLSSSSPCCSETITEQFNVPQGADPQVILSVSDDGSRSTKLLRKSRSIGKLGKYLTRIRWLKMGQFRQRVITLEITDPVPRKFTGFYVDNEEGSN